MGSEMKPGQASAILASAIIDPTLISHGLIERSMDGEVLERGPGQHEPSDCALHLVASIVAPWNLFFTLHAIIEATERRNEAMPGMWLGSAPGVLEGLRAAGEALEAEIAMKACGGGATPETEESNHG